MGRLSAICRVHFEFALARPAEYRAMFNAFLGVPVGGEDVMHSANRPALEALVKAVGEWQRENVACSVSTRRIAASLWSAIHGLAMLTLDRQVMRLVGGDGDPDGMIALVISATLAGIAAQTRG